MVKKRRTTYLLFCSKCGLPQPIPLHVIHVYFIPQVEGVYCMHCNNKTIIPEYLKRLRLEL